VFWELDLVFFFCVCFFSSRESIPWSVLMLVLVLGTFGTRRNHTVESSALDLKRGGGVIGIELSDRK
jgi:hypothetical protein